MPDQPPSVIGPPAVPPTPPGSTPEPSPRGWSVRERPARERQSWEVPTFVQPPAPSGTPPVAAAPVAPAPGPAPVPAPPTSLAPFPAPAQHPGGSPDWYQPPPPPAPAGGGPVKEPFPTTRQLVAVAAAAAVVVAGVGVSLLRSGSAAAPAPLLRPAVAVVHDGPAALAAVSLSGGSQKRSISVAGSPSAMVTSADGSKAYLLDTGGAQVTPVDLAAGRAGTPFPAGKLPTDLELSSDGATLYVVDNLSNSLIAVNTVSGTARPAMQLPGGAMAFTPSPAGGGGLLALYTGEGQPGIVGFYSFGGGIGKPIVVGQGSPDKMVFSPDGSTAWVVEPGPGSAAGAVVPVDARTQTAGTPIPVGHAPTDAAISGDGRLLVVTNSIDRTVSVIDLGARRVLATVGVGAGPSAVAISADGATAWVACSLDRTLVPVDLRSGGAGTALPLPNTPGGVALPASGSAWVLYPSTAGTIVPVGGGAPARVGNGPSLLIAHDVSTAWVANSLSDTVQSVDLARGTAGAPVAVAHTPEGLALTPDDRTLLVLSVGDGVQPGTLTAVDTASAKALRSLPVGVAPSSLTLAPDGSTAYIANHQTNAITIVDVRAWRVSGSIALPCSPSQLVITPDGADVYAACRSANAVVPITTATDAVGTPISVGGDPRLVMGNQGKLVFVRADGELQEILVASNAVVLSHPETGNLLGLTPTPDDSTLVATDNTGGVLLLVSAATLLTTTSVQVSPRPSAPALSPDGTHAYVLDTSQQKLYTVDVLAGRLTATADVSPGAAYVAVPATQP